MPSNYTVARRGQTSQCKRALRAESDGLGGLGQAVPETGATEGGKIVLISSDIVVI